MSGALREWIGPLLEEKLGTALEILKTNQLSEIHLKDSTLGYREGLLTIHSTKAKILQVIDLPGHDAYPSRITLWDSRHVIHATFNQDAIDLYEKQSGRDFSSIKGSIISIRDFFIVSTFVVTSPQEITLEISKFKLIGAGGSHNVRSTGDISAVRSIQQLLSQIRRVLSNEQSIFSQGVLSPRALVGKFQSATMDCSSNFGAVSQPGFATQVEEVARERVLATSVPSAATATAYANLLGLLKKDHKPKVDDHKISPRVIVEKISQSIPTRMTDHPQRIPLAQVSNDRKMEMTSKLDSLANVSASHSKNSSQSISSSCPNSQTLPHSRHQATSSEDNIRSPNGSDKNHQQDNQQLHSQASLVDSVHSFHEVHEVPGLRNDRSGMPFIDQFQMEHPFQGLKRIPRKYFQIPKEQNAILEGDSWFDHANNCSYASIPKDARDSIADFLGQLNAKPNNVISKGRDTFDSRLEEDSRPSNVSAAADDTQSLHSSGSSADISESESSDPKFWAPRATNNRNDLTTTVETVQQELQQTQSHQNRRSASQGSEEDCEPLVSQCGVAGVSFQPTLQNALSHRDSEPLILNHITPKRRGSRFPQKSFTMPSSSPSDEDEIELAVPLAVGDIVNASEEGTRFDDPGSPEWPSTLMEESQVVQVNQTPIAKSRSLATNKFRQRAELDLANIDTPRLDDVLSDPFIPATFHDASPQLVRTTPKAVGESNMAPWKATAAGKATSAQTFVESPQNNAISATSKGVDFAEPREFFQDVAQLPGNTNAQLKSRAPQTSSTLHALPPCSKSAPGASNKGPELIHSNTQPPFQTSRSFGAGLIDLSMDRSSSPIRLSYSPNEDSPTPPQACSTRPQSELLSMSSPHQSLTTLKRSNGSVADSPNTKPSKRQRRRSIAAAILDEDDCTPRDTKEMARASRHDFHDLLPASTKLDISSPVVHGSQCSSPASTTDQLCNLTRSPSSGNRPLSQGDNVGYCNSPQDQLQSIPTPSQVGPARTIENSDLKISRRSSTFSQHSVARSNGLVPKESGVQPTSVGGNPWANFKAFYPDYEGSESHFTKTLVYIEWLNHQNHLVQSCFCDDLIRVFACEYLDYVEECKSSKVKPSMNGWQFYVSKITARLYQQNVINLGNLQESLALLEAERVEKYRQTFGPSASVPLTGQTRLAQSLEDDCQTQVESFEGQLKDTEEDCDGGDSQDGGGERNRESMSVKIVPISRKPFFETRSQLLAAGPRRSPSRSSEGSAKVRQSRVLPWPVSTSKHSPSPNERSPGSSPSSKSGGQTPSSSLKSRPQSRQRPSRMLPMGSPILGRQYASTPPTRQDAAPRARKSSSGHEQVRRPSCSPHVNSVLQDQQRAGAKTPSEKTVEGWLDGVNAEDSRFKNDRFWKFARKRLSSGDGFSSRTSTPTATPAKRFCTKPLEGAPFGA